MKVSKLLRTALAGRTVSVAGTPNPRVTRFSVPGVDFLRQVGGKSVEFPTALERGYRCDLAEKITALPTVESVMMGTDYLSITSSSLAPNIRKVIKDLVESAEDIDVYGSTPLETNGAVSDSVADAIRQVLTERVRPGVQADGGDVEFISFDNGTATLKLLGACAGCPQSQQTLKTSIEKTLQFFVPEVVRVEQYQDERPRVLQHTMQTRPLGKREAVELYEQGIPFMSLFAARPVSVDMLERVGHMSTLDLERSYVASGRLEAVQVTCSDCRAARTIEAVDSLLLDARNSAGQACLVLCPACTLRIKLKVDSTEKEKEGP